jgi:hypothetical protein
MILYSPAMPGCRSSKKTMPVKAARPDRHRIFGCNEPDHGPGSDPDPAAKAVSGEEAFIGKRSA